MKNCLPLIVLAISVCAVIPARGQGVAHTPLRGITVKLHALPAEGVTDTLDSSRHVPFDLETTTDDDGEFMFGYVPPGTYALGCSYTACYTAFRNGKGGLTAPDTEGGSATSEDPTMEISVNACQGMVCRVAVNTMTPEDWSSNARPSGKTNITREWSNSIAWLRNGGGITLRIDGSNSVISGTIEAR